MDNYLKLSITNDTIFDLNLHFDNISAGCFSNDCSSK